MQKNKDFLWEQYKHSVDLHRSYLDLAIKLNIFYYAITGAVISFYFLHSTEPLIRYSLILPFFMSIALAVFFIRSAGAADVSQQDLKTMAAKLDFEVYSVIAAVLAYLLRVFFYLMIIASLGLAVLFFKMK